MLLGTESEQQQQRKHHRYLGLWRKAHTITGLITLFASFILIIIGASKLYLLLFGSSTSNSPSFPLKELADKQVCGTHLSERITKIPNIVHYVWFLKDPTSLHLDFKFFITAYSAYLYFQPDKIYYHTDASFELFERARRSGSEWTQRLLSLPNVEYHYVDAPSVTTKGIPIEKFEHKSDFTRMQVLHEYGGIYMDTDAIPLRDIADLRESGFANVVGGAIGLTMHHSGFINNGVMMAAPGSALMKIYMRAADQFFDGRWETASVNLLTDVANRLSAVPHEVLILQPKAFAPVSWEYADQVRLFQPHFEMPAGNEIWGSTSTNMTTCDDMLSSLIEKESFGGEDWEMDFSSSYVLHAFDGKHIPGWDNKVDLNYILARQSNYARAVYPAIAHAISSGVLGPY
ncbi:uncharacterized protein LY89DRAFT_572803 [Mollisia scopiformis]|uniref:Glycosyltransferase family 32 protein n=1 Tax=Mollisia scopiformis TaxID=149040 RepID=A0A194XWF4_MOLSC|nr:uncharacterized protein LY89DRAFT_572803 [Mollisia scopiformis]KUJ24630.1 hypothetical protein LY89DRAFT_572803 [Mollisia scopiformis]